MARVRVACPTVEPCVEHATGAIAPTEGRPLIGSRHLHTRPRVLDVLLVGPYPPPIGGISVHVQRLARELVASGLSVAVLDHYGGRGKPSVVVAHLNRNPLRYWTSLGRWRARAVHYHHSRWSTLLAVALRAKVARSPYVITFHDHALCDSARSSVPGVPLLTRWAVKQFAAGIYVSDSILSHHRGARVVLGGRQEQVIPAYLSPATSDIPAVDDELQRFLDELRTVCVVSAFRVVLTGPGEDLYGLDTAVDAFSVLAREDGGLGLVVFVAIKPRRRGPQRAYVQGLQERLLRAGLQHQVLWRFDTPLLPALRPRVIYLRPTRSEGDAVSVREALALRVPVIASDVSERPAGTRVVRTGSTSDLVAAIQDVRNGHGATPAQPTMVATLAVERYLRVYRSSEGGRAR